MVRGYVLELYLRILLGLGLGFRDSVRFRIQG